MFLQAIILIILYFYSTEFTVFFPFFWNEKYLNLNINYHSNSSFKIQFQEFLKWYEYLNSVATFLNNIA